jgi:hypothetical protein
MMKPGWQYTVRSLFLSVRLLCGAEHALRYQDLQTQSQPQNSAFLLRRLLTYSTSLHHLA